MSREDFKKYIETCVDLTHSGNIISYEDKFYDCVQSFVQNNSDNNIKNLEDNWFRFLRYKSEMCEDFLDWYDNMTFEALDKKELEKYHIPTEKLVIPISNEELFVHSLHKLFSDWYDSWDITSNDLVIIDMAFNEMIISLSYDILTGYKKGQAIKQSFTSDIVPKVRSLIKQFNENQGKNGVHVECHTTVNKGISTRAFTNDFGKLIKSESARVIEISLEDLFYTYNKKPANLDYINKFFNIVKDERSKGMKNIDHLPVSEFEKLTGKQPILV